MKSSLADREIKNPNFEVYRNRNGGGVKYVMPHHAASTGSAESIAKYMINAKVSTHYVIDEKEIISCVGEEHGTYSAGHYTANLESVSFEMKNSSKEGWTISPEVWSKAIELTADIMRRHALKRAVYGETIKLHRDFVATACPGAYFAGRIHEFCAQVNALLGVMPDAPEPPPAAGAPPIVIDIGRHSEKPEVLALQRALMARSPGCLPKYGADGDFGTETEEACFRVLGTRVPTLTFE
jgi:hypothetical protein